MLSLSVSPYLTSPHRERPSSPPKLSEPKSRRQSFLRRPPVANSTLWSRWADARPDADVYATLALLSFTLPDADPILRRWDEPPLELRPFSILALPHVQDIMSAAARPRSISSSSRYSQDEEPFSDYDPRTPPLSPGQSRTDGSSRFSDVVQEHLALLREHFPDAVIHLVDREADEDIADDVSQSSGDTEYFDALDETPISSPISSPRPRRATLATLASTAYTRTTQYSGMEVSVIPSGGKLTTSIPRVTARSIFVSSVEDLNSRAASNHNPSTLDLTESSLVNAHRMQTPIPRLLPRDILMASQDYQRLSYAAPIETAETDLWLHAQRQLMHRPLIDFIPDTSDVPSTIEQASVQTSETPKEPKRKSRFSLRIFRRASSRAGPGGGW